MIKGGGCESGMRATSSASEDLAGSPKAAANPAAHVHLRLHGEGQLQRLVDCERCGARDERIRELEAELAKRPRDPCEEYYRAEKLEARVKEYEAWKESAEKSGRGD